ncbi:helix-turn-helix transcriptional regulator [Bradyrhizobium sp. Ghvi]|uniref:helix-turn-helix transcriptional regulator n=1 Tax=Bradyrhizobium sp. Ghvi TaxID=1855319 RepID=UPI001FCD1E9E|nr:helix-turn-helix transcriptional regulator [Bradyrhizobium sp. Ghvi]
MAVFAHERSCASGLECAPDPERGIPQDQLAYDAGIDRSRRIEQKKENPTIDLMDRIAATFGIHLSELFAEPPRVDPVPERGVAGSGSPRSPPWPD